MSAEERQREIVRAARRTGAVDLAEPAAELGVAKETVRRDLRAPEDHGLVRPRVLAHGSWWLLARCPAPLKGWGGCGTARG